MIYEGKSRWHLFANDVGGERERERVEFDFRDRHYRPTYHFLRITGGHVLAAHDTLCKYFLPGPFSRDGKEGRGREREVVFRPTRELTSLQLPPPQRQLSYTEYVTRGSRSVKMHVRRK